MRRSQQADKVKSVPEGTDPTDPIDHEAIAYCAREVEGKDIPSIEEVRPTLAKVRGPLAESVVAGREDRV